MRFMRRGKRPTEVCQNCRYGNNDFGKSKYNWKRFRYNYKKGEHHLDPNRVGYWHILCVKNSKFRPWDLRKRCFTK